MCEISHRSSLRPILWALGFSMLMLGGLTRAYQSPHTHPATG